MIEFFKPFYLNKKVISNQNINKLLQQIQLGFGIIFIQLKFFDSSMQNHHYVQSYEILCCVGDGSQGQAFLARKEDKNYVIKLYLSSPRAQENFSKQVEILQQINSPYIIRMIQHYDQARSFLGVRQEIRPAIVLDYAEHGQLFKIVYHTGRLHQNVCRTLFYQMLKAIKALKDLNITHRDIKLQNILLDDKFNIKLADFGLARNSEGDNHDFYLQSWKGSQQYMAPEIHQLHYKGEKVDLFAAGVALFFMFARCSPFKEAKPGNFYYRLIIQGKRQQYWSKIEKGCKIRFPNNLKVLFDKLFTPNPQARPSVQEIFNEQWLNGRILTNQELKESMEPHYLKLMKKDKETSTARQKMKEKLEAIVIEHNNANQERQRSRQNNQNHRQEGGIRSQHPEEAIKDILEFKIQREKLPLIRYHSNYYSEVTPTKALLWVNQFLHELKIEKTKLFQYTLETIELNDYQINYDCKGRIALTLMLDIASETDSVISEITLHGQITCWDGKISIHWKDSAGTTFSNYELIQTLNKQFQLTFGCNKVY